MTAIIIVVLGIVLAIALAEWFKSSGERRWNQMTDEEKLDAIARWRASG